MQGPKLRKVVKNAKFEEFQRLCIMLGGKFRKRLIDEKGATTAEFAICLPGVILMLAVIIGFSAYSGQQMKCQRAAENVLREAILGEAGDNAKYEDIARATIGSDYDKANLSVDYDDKWVNVSVTLSLEGGPLGVFKEVSSSAKAHLER